MGLNSACLFSGWVFVYRALGQMCRLQQTLTILMAELLMKVWSWLITLEALWIVYISADDLPRRAAETTALCSAGKVQHAPTLEKGAFTQWKFSMITLEGPLHFCSPLLRLLLRCTDKGSSPFHREQPGTIPVHPMVVQFPRGGHRKKHQRLLMISPTRSISLPCY